MGLFRKENPLQKEWRKVVETEKKYVAKRMDKSDSFINKKLSDKVPEKLQDTLNKAFAKAFALIFDKGTGIIEKAGRTDKIEEGYRVKDFESELKQDSKSLKAFSKGAKNASSVNLLVSGASGIGMGLIGVGLPDIPLFTGFLLKNLYEISSHFGYKYDTAKERFFLLLVVQGGLSYGEKLEEINRRINRFIVTKQLPENYDEAEEIKRAAGCLSQELLYMKFLQGIPVVGAVGGAYDAVYMKKISVYGEMKYRRRFLSDRIQKEKSI